MLRNLRGTTEAGVDQTLIEQAISARKGADKVLPFRFVAAARACPRLERALDQSLLASLADLPVLSGKTIVLVDVSGSMYCRLSAKSNLTRLDAACTLASMIQGESVRVFSFSDETVEVPHRLGMAGVDKIRTSQDRGGTDLGGAMRVANGEPHDRLIVITDEQSHTHVSAPRAPLAYLINVASNQNGVGYHDGWTHIDGFSEKVLLWIHEVEKMNAA